MAEASLRSGSILALTLALASAFGCKREHRLIIGVVPKGQAHIFWQTVHAGAEAAARECGVQIIWNGPASEIEFSRQINIVEDMINRRVDGIVLAPAHGKSLVPVVEKALRANIPVTIFDSGIEMEGYVSYVSTDNYRGGVVGAERMAQILGPSSSTRQVAIIGVIPGSVSTTERENGFKDTIEKSYPHIKIVAFQYGMSDRAKSLAVAEDILTANPDLDGIFAANESSTLGAAQAVKSRGLAGRVKIVGFDSSPSLIEDLKAGVIDSLILQDPFAMGYQGVKTIWEKLQGKTPPKRIDTGVYVVHRDNLNDPKIWKLLNPPIAEYLR